MRCLFMRLNVYRQGEELLCYSMFANLFRNALEASPPEHPIVITLDREKETAVIRIQNTDLFRNPFVIAFLKNMPPLGSTMARDWAHIPPNSSPKPTAAPSSLTLQRLAVPP
jgi:hypothetical protein